MLDVDECIRNQHNCQHICKNTEGSFICDCQFGFNLANDGISCERMYILHAESLALTL